MYSLPDNAERVAADFTELGAAQKDALISSLRELDVVEQSKQIEEVMANGGVEARFMRHVLGKDPRGRADSPKNKKMGPPETI